MESVEWFSEMICHIFATYDRPNGVSRALCVDAFIFQHYLNKGRSKERA